MTGLVRKKAKLDSILAHCLMRAVIESLGGADEAQRRWDAGEVQVNAWTGVKATPKASRVATFIVLWALGMVYGAQDEFSITEYQRRWNVDERQAYRLQREFRELWPEYETPHELAVQIVRQLDRRTTKREAARLPLTLEIQA